MSQRIVSSVPDWSSVRHALDLGCGAASSSTPSPSSSRNPDPPATFVGSARPAQRPKPAFSSPTTPSGPPASRASRNTSLAGELAQWPGDRGRTLRSATVTFDVVVSAAFVVTSQVVGVVWDLVHAEEYVQRLSELKMDEIRLSERVNGVYGHQSTSFPSASHLSILWGPLKLGLNGDQQPL
ncbi:hypothetical protein SASPL_157514 [Salvia splendens]|uniref:Uncharacterized protein n=1 Tax=Salvia splendens TaxID=180675 RepID=A0A8X8VUT8_SALSN|nr:hypothetical protein SASPL_157514 [Salvia splendens]